MIDGEHASIGRLLISARNSEEAWALGDSLTHDTDCWWECGQEHPWSFFDGSTASKLNRVDEISDAEFAVAKDVVGLTAYEVEYEQSEIDVNISVGPSS